MNRPNSAIAFLCFGAYGVSSFKGQTIRVKTKYNFNCFPFAIDVHCCNLVFKTLSKLGIMSQNKGLLKFAHAYFKFSPNRHLEFVRLAELMETKRLKLLKIVKT